MNCHACKQGVGADDRFCLHCGQPLPQAAPHHAGAQAGLLGGEFDVAALTQLRHEKARLTTELQTLLDKAVGRPMTADERRVWTTLHARWTEVSTDLTRRMQYYNARRAYDRRTTDRRLHGSRKTFPAVDIPDAAATERRSGDRRGSDRRNPFPENPS